MMKTQKQIRSLFLACVALASLLIIPATARADADGTKPYKGTVVTTSRTDEFGPGYWSDPYLVQARLSALGVYFDDAEVISEGRDNYNGPFTEVDHQILYITSFVPMQGTVYIWAEKTYNNGLTVWAAVTGDVDFETGNVEGEWTSFTVNDPSSTQTGSGTWVAAVRPDLGDRFYETTIAGRVATKGASQQR